MVTDKQVIVVTGSSGRVGTRILERLVDEYQPVGLDFVGITQKDPNLEFVYVDLSSDKSVECAFNRIRHLYGNKISSIIHLAAFYSFSGEHLELYDAITVEGTRRVLREAKKFEVEQFIFTSTMLVHEPSERGVIQNEDSPIRGKWHYPASKVRTEKVIREEHGDIPYVIVRIAGCYDDECNCIPISQHISRIYEKQLASIVYPGDSSHGVPYTHFDDLTDMVMLLIHKRRELQKELVFLCCEEDSITYRELQTEFGQLLHGKEKWAMMWVPKFFAKFGAWVQNHTPFMQKPFIKPWMVDLADDNYEFTMEKSRKVLDWSPKRSLRKTLPILVEDMQKDPIAWYKRHNIPKSHYVKKHSKEKK
ncbi:MAG: N-acetyl-alpha-D-glucosaminyl-diphospho-ditrans,octacis-undecaprenol 4-epimerase [Chlamydiae bacterium]|nr:N-acetyl-alpha-D-glucosaminyl-diphospho-ditrans,octacis-undecaprenol 4-epimerase [Chlamydiota bacterium]